MYPRLFSNPALSTCGLCIGIGVVLCVLAGRYYVRVKKMSRAAGDFFEWNAYIAIAFGFGFAALGQALFNYIENPAAGFHVTSSITILSGLLGGTAVFLAVYLTWGQKRIGPRLIEVMPVVPVCMAVAQMCGRIGCFCAGCCYGRPTHSRLGVRFPALGYPAYPTQLFEAGFLLVMFSIMFELVVRRNFKQTLALYMLAYGTFRFFIEFLRGDPRGAFIGSLSPSQSLSILLVAGAAPVYFVTERLLGQYRANASLKNKI